MPHSSERLLTPRYLLMCGFTFTVFFSAFMLFPTAPFHILDLGGSNFTAGLFLAFLTYGSAVSAPFTGAMADRLGKKRTLLVSSLVLSGLALGYAQTGTLHVLLAIVPIHGVFWSAMLTASAAHLVDLVPESRRAEGIAYWGLSTVGAIAVAPTFAFWLYDLGGWRSLALVSAGLNLVMATIASRLKERSREVGEPEGGFVEWRVLAVSVTLFLFSFGYGGITSFVALYAEASGTGMKGLYFTALALVILVTRPPMGRLADRAGHRRVLLPCLALTSAGLLLLVPGGTLPWLSASAVVFGLGFGSAFPVFTAYIMQRVSPRKRGAAFGSMLCAFDIGIGTGSMCLGFVVERSSFSSAFALAGVLAALALPYFLLSTRRLMTPRRGSATPA